MRFRNRTLEYDYKHVLIFNRHILYASVIIIVTGNEMGHRIDPFGGPSQCSTTGVAKAVVCGILSVL